MSMHGGRLYEFGPFLLDAAERKLTRRGKPITLPHKAFDLLLVLVNNDGRLVEKDELLREVWPDVTVEEANLSVHVASLRRVLGDDAKAPRFIETVPKHGYRFIAGVRRSLGDEEKALLRPMASEIGGETGEGTAFGHAAAARALPQWRDGVSAFEMAIAQPGLAGGAVPLSSRYYIERPVDEEFRSAIADRHSTVLIKGPRQVGKTSLLARGLQRAREVGSKVILTDFQSLGQACLASAETLLLALAGSIADQLELDRAPAETWLQGQSPGVNLGRYLRREVFAKVSAPVVWGLDEVDRLFTCHYANEVFGLFRSWHNARALDPDAGWHKLTLAMSYATEARLLITDPHQSPFNVGTRLLLEDFNFEQVAELNRRYGGPLRDETEVRHYFRLLNGQPYLTHKGIYEMAARGMPFTTLAAHADDEAGIFADHLQRVLAVLRHDGELRQVMLSVLRGEAGPDAAIFHRLRSAGIVKGDSASEARPRCELYASYLVKHLR